jgi:hypothetical protein
LGRAYSARGESRGAHRVFVRKPEGRRLLGRPRLRRVNNIKIYLQEGGCGLGQHCFGSGQGQVAGCCECGDIPSDSIKSGEFLD